MFKKELKSNLKSFILWTIVLIAVYLLVYLMYPSIIKSGNIEQIDEMMKLFPDEILKAFNMDISSLDSAYGWLKSEGFIFILLITGCYSSIMGSNILLKEENDKTIEYISMLPISRTKILNSKVLASLFYIVSMIFFITIFNLVSLKISGPLDVKEFLLISITPLFSSIVFFFISLFISNFTHKSKKILGFSIGIVFLSYIFNTLTALDKSVEFLKYVSVFTLSDLRNVILNNKLDFSLILISFIICIILYILSLIKYNKKEMI